MQSPGRQSLQPRRQPSHLGRRCNHVDNRRASSAVRTCADTTFSPRLFEQTTSKFAARSSPTTSKTRLCKRRASVGSYHPDVSKNTQYPSVQGEEKEDEEDKEERKLTMVQTNSIVQNEKKERLIVDVVCLQVRVLF